MSLSRRVIILVVVIAAIVVVKFAPQNAPRGIVLPKTNVAGVTTLAVQKGGELVTVRFAPSVDPLLALNELASEQKWDAAAVVSSVGSLTRASIRCANQESATKLSGHFEIIAMTGTVSRLGSHLHISIADSLGEMTGGHLMEGSSVYTTLELMLAVLPDSRYTREFDEASGYHELTVRPK